MAGFDSGNFFISSVWQDGTLEIFQRIQEKKRRERPQIGKLVGAPEPILRRRSGSTLVSCVSNDCVVTPSGLGGFDSSLNAPSLLF